MTEKQRAPRNRTITLSAEERRTLRRRLIASRDVPNAYLDRTFLGDFRELTNLLPKGFADLIFLDPPYNLDKQFGERKFSRRSVDEYTTWLGEILDTILPALKPTG